MLRVFELGFFFAFYHSWTA